MEGNNNYEVNELTYSALEDPFDIIELPDSVIQSFVVFITPIIKEYYLNKNDERI